MSRVTLTTCGCSQSARLRYNARCIGGLIPFPLAILRVELLPSAFVGSWVLLEAIDCSAYHFPALEHALTPPPPRPVQDDTSVSVAALASTSWDFQQGRESNRLLFCGTAAYSAWAHNAQCDVKGSGGEHAPTRPPLRRQRPGTAGIR